MKTIEEALNDVDVIVRRMRQSGILTLKVGGFEVGLDPRGAPVNEPDTKDVKGVDNSQPVREVKRGRDGLTAAQQIEVLGRIVDDDLLTG